MPGCIQAIGTDFAKSVVVVDSGSTDDTSKIALSLNAQVIDFKWDGKFPKKRNWFLRTHAPETKWVLFIDADEYLTEEFKVEIIVRYILSMLSIASFDSNRFAFSIPFSITAILSFSGRATTDSTTSADVIAH